MNTRYIVDLMQTAYKPLSIIRVTLRLKKYSSKVAAVVFKSL